jgi:hypothetical protein
MALTRLEASPRYVLLICTECGHRELWGSRDAGRAARAAHEYRVHGIPARTSPGAWAVRKARQRARARERS